ncbi:MAG: nuclear transport factor 2 family protein [Phycisphaerales bacterium]|nr:nuclear transport factor 2 family protein [Phycisphaerales bacterium]
MSTTASTIAQIANDLVAHCQTPTDDFVEHDAKIWDKHYADNWISIEGDGKTFQGRDEVIAKYREWEKGVTMHGCEVIGPFLGQTGFSVIFDMDIECNNGTFPRMRMKEIANYTVENDKIVKEEFCYQYSDQCAEDC